VLNLIQPTGKFNVIERGRLSRRPIEATLRLFETLDMAPYKMHPAAVINL